MFESIFPETMGRYPVGLIKTEEPAGESVLPLTIFYPAEQGTKGEEAEYSFSEWTFGDCLNNAYEI